jgi:hypothetical protein
LEHCWFSIARSRDLDCEQGGHAMNQFVTDL